MNVCADPLTWMISLALALPKGSERKAGEARERDIEMINPIRDQS